MTGRLIGHYRLIDKLGEGGMGKVYRAIDTMVEREVAMKSLKPELAARPEVVERFRSEATTLARLNHPNVAQLYSFFKDGNEFFMVMEFVPGKTLERVILDGGPMPWRQALEIAAQVLDGIQHAHQLGILHRDVKPANIILLDPGKGTGGFQPSAKIMDFGIAQALGSTRLTREGHLIGTLEYLAPERIQGKPADARSDLYSMAIVLFEMLTGRLPFHSDSEYSLLLAQVQQQPPRPRDTIADLPAAVEATLLRALEKDPARRFPDAAAFATALRQHIAPAPHADTSAHAAAYQIDQFLAEMARIFRDPQGISQSLTRLRRALTLAWRDTTFRVVTVCGAILLLALSTLLTFVAARRWQQPPQEVAVANEPDPASPSDQTRQPTTPTLVPETPILPGTPIPIDQIFGAQPAGPGNPTPSAPNSPDSGNSEAGPPSPTPQGPALPTPGSQNPAGRTTGGQAPGGQAPAVRTAPSAVPWDVVAKALDLTDGPTSGEPGQWPIHRAGLLAALRIGAAAWLPQITREVERRGVNFLLTASADQSFRAAGADAALVSAIEKNLRSAVIVSSTNAAPAGTATANPSPKPPTAAPARPAPKRLREVRTLYVERLNGELDNMLREEIVKELAERIQLTQSADAADARMTAKLEENEGGFVSGAGRVFGLKDKVRLTVRILANGSSRELWRHETGDRSPFTGAIGSNAMQRAVSRIVNRLEKDLKD